jgi:hypothetical protein
MEIAAFTKRDGTEDTANQEVDPLGTGWNGETAKDGANDKDGTMSQDDHDEDEHGNGSDEDSI